VRMHVSLCACATDVGAAEAAEAAEAAAAAAAAAAATAAATAAAAAAAAAAAKGIKRNNKRKNIKRRTKRRKGGKGKIRGRNAEGEEDPLMIYPLLLFLLRECVKYVSLLYSLPC